MLRALPLLLLGVASPLHGLGIEFGYFDSEVLARGNAGVASATGPSGVYFNPALLGQSPRAEVLLSAYAIDLDIEFTNAAGRDELDGDTALAPSAFGMLPLGGDSALGFGVYTPFGQKNEWRETSPVRNLALDTELYYLAGSLAYGMQLAPGLRVGLSASVVQSDADLNRGLVVPGDRFSFEGDGGGWGLGAGFAWSPVEEHTLAGSFRWWSPVTYKGVLGTRTIVPAPSAIAVPAESTIDFPREWTLGYAWRPCDEWLFEFDVMFTEWSAFDQLTITNPGGVLVEPLNWSNSFKIGTGVTRFLDSGWWIGAGYWFAETTTPDLTFNPRLPDVPIHVVSAGTGYRGDQWALELTYQFGYGNARTITGAAPIPPSGVTANGKMTYLAHALSASLRWAW